MWCRTPWTVTTSNDPGGKSRFSASLTTNVVLPASPSACACSCARRIVSGEMSMPVTCPAKRAISVVWMPLPQPQSRIRFPLAGSCSQLKKNSSLATDPGLIIVEGPSRDGTWRVIQELARDHDWVRGVHLMRNYGQHNALLCGIRLARNELIVTMDDDLQHPPEEIPKLLEKLTADVDVVYGPPAQETHGLWRDFARDRKSVV